MRDNSARELLLQNRLALAATLLFQASQILNGREKCNLPILLLEIEGFFSETKNLLAAELAAEVRAAAMPTSAPPAEKSGERWRQEGFNGWQSPFRVPLPTPGIEETLSPAHSSLPLSGGTTAMEPALLNNFAERIRLSYTTKL